MVNASSDVVPPVVPRRSYGIFHWIGRTILAVSGWRFEGQFPALGRCVAIAAPHTSNWDFVYAMATVLALELDIRYLGKDKLFDTPVLGRLFAWLGGIPVDQSGGHGVVGQSVEIIREREQIILALAPEGTRKLVESWRTGFYSIALEAEVPIAVAALNYRDKAISIIAVFHPTGDRDADLTALTGLYDGIMPRHPGSSWKGHRPE